MKKCLTWLITLERVTTSPLKMRGERIPGNTTDKHTPEPSLKGHMNAYPWEQEPDEEVTLTKI